MNLSYIFKTLVKTCFYHLFLNPLFLYNEYMTMEKTKITTQETVDINFVQKEFVENHNSCVLCGSQLEFSYSFSEEDNTTTESAHCPSCEIRVRSTKHPVN